MDIITTVFVFVLVWWLVIFTVLPWGNRASDKPEIGHAASAPANPRLKQKLLWTTGISLVLTGILWGMAEYGGWSFAEMIRSWSKE
jgi:predicted secreted protein